ncbi:MAG: DUF3352 domain-containing protein [Bacteroidales bacterium]|jgi:antitoxin component YwqK of YwqJK toxin-antitoxin module
MKKIFRVLLFLIAIVAIICLAYKYLFSGKSSFQSIYLVPANAAMIIESGSVSDAWEKIIHSDAWEKISRIDYLSELNKKIQSADSLLSDKKLVLKAIGKRKTMVSVHEYLPGRYDYLFILDVGRAARLRNPGKMLSSVPGDNFRMTKRDYNDKTIYELLDIGSGEMYYFTLIRDKIVLSTNHRLVEASIDEKDKMTIGRDLEFIDVSKRISGKGLFNVYINYSYFPEFLRNTLGKPVKNISNLRQELTYSAFSFNITDEGLVSLEGYTGVNDSVSSVFTAVLNAGSGPIKSAEIIPARVASMVKLSFDNASEYYTKTLADLNREEYENYTGSLKKIEKKLKINIEDNFLSWFDDEIVLLQTKPSNLGRTNEFATIIKAKNRKDPKANLDYLERQIKRNTPVKVREVAYGDYSIHYISFPGLLKALFGKMLGKIEKPYYTIINKYVIFSNHPQTLKNIIDDYISGNTLENSFDYNLFTKQFDRKQSAYTYLDIPVLFSNLKEFVSPENWQKLNRNKPYISSFSKAGIQIDRKDNLLHLLMKTKYSSIIEDYSKETFNAESFMSLFSASGEDGQETGPEAAWYDPEIIIHDLDAREMEEFYEDGAIKFSIDLKRGIKHGTYKEFHENGELKVKGKYRNDWKDGTWELYDDEGNLLEKKTFPEDSELEDH